MSRMFCPNLSCQGFVISCDTTYHNTVRDIRLLFENMLHCSPCIFCGTSVSTESFLVQGLCQLIIHIMKLSSNVSFNSGTHYVPTLPSTLLWLQLSIFGTKSCVIRVKDVETLCNSGD